MAAPESVTDEELARMHEACQANLKKGLFAISVAVRDLIKLLDEIKRLRAIHVSGPGLGAGGPAPPEGS